MAPGPLRGEQAHRALPGRPRLPPEQGLGEILDRNLVLVDGCFVYPVWSNPNALTHAPLLFSPQMTSIITGEPDHQVRGAPHRPDPRQAVVHLLLPRYVRSIMLVFTAYARFATA